MKLDQLYEDKDTVFAQFPYEKNVTAREIHDDAGEFYINSIARDLFAEDDILSNVTNQRVLSHSKKDGLVIEEGYDGQQQRVASIASFNNGNFGDDDGGLSQVLDRQISAKQDKQANDNEQYPIFSLGGGYTMCYNSKYKNVSLSRYFTRASGNGKQLGKYEKYQMGLPVNALPMLVLACLEYMRVLPDNTVTPTFHLARNTTCKDEPDVTDILTFPEKKRNRTSDISSSAAAAAVTPPSGPPPQLKRTISVRTGLVDPAKKRMHHTRFDQDEAMNSDLARHE